MTTRGDYGPLLDALRGVRWPARRVVPAGPAGQHASTLRGLAAEFTEYRAYRQGDDPRRLDWKLLARTDRPYLRLSEARAILRTLIALDASASMVYPIGTEAKWWQARRLAVALAAVAHGSGDPVGLVVTGQTVDRLPPRTRRGTVGEITRAIDAMRPGGPDRLADAISHGHALDRTVLISDFLSDEDALLRAGRHFVVQGAELHAVHVIAREELDPPPGTYLAVDPDRPALRRPFDDELRAAYHERFTAWRETLADRWRQAGAHYTAVVSDEPADRAVRRLVQRGA